MSLPAYGSTVVLIVLTPSCSLLLPQATLLFLEQLEAMVPAIRPRAMKHPHQAHGFEISRRVDPSETVLHVVMQRV